MAVPSPLGDVKIVSPISTFVLNTLTLNLKKSAYVNCGVKNYMKEDHRSYIRNFCTCEKRACGPYKPDLFSSSLFATAKIAYFTAMIFLHIILHFAVHIYDVHIFMTSVVGSVSNNDGDVNESGQN